MPTGVFNPFKLTDRSVIIGSLVLLTAVSDIYHFTEIVVSFKQTVKTLIIQILFYSPSALCLHLICTVCQIPLYGC